MYCVLHCNLYTHNIVFQNSHSDLTVSINSSHWPLDDILKLQFSISFHWLVSSKNNALGWMPKDLTDDRSTLVQVMAWCRQATSHCLTPCWPSSMSHMASPGDNEIYKVRFDKDKYMFDNYIRMYTIAISLFLCAQRYTLCLIAGLHQVA